MKNNEKKLIIVLIAVLVIGGIIVSIAIKNGNKKEKNNKNDINENNNVVEEKYVSQLEDGTKLNISEELNETKKYKDLEISNIQYTEKDGMTVLLADVTNVGDTIQKEEIVKIVVLGENGETLTDFKTIIEEIKPGETKQINASVTADFANAKDFKIEAE